MARYEELNRRLEKHQATDMVCPFFSHEANDIKWPYHKTGRGQSAVLQASLATGGRILSTSWTSWNGLAQKAQSIHPASRGVAAHTAGLFRSVRGAKGGVESPPVEASQAREFSLFLPVGASQAREFSLFPRGGFPS